MKFKITLVLCCTVVILGLLFWPTLYKYEKLEMGRATLLIRINRLTGAAEELKPWESEVQQKPLNQLPSSELELLNGTMEKGAASTGNFWLDLYNGSSWTVREVTLRIGLHDESGRKRWIRDFSESTNIAPRSSNLVSIRVGSFDATDIFAWEIISAEGVAAK